MGAEPPAGFIPLFNGKNLDGWQGWNILAAGGSPADIAALAPGARARAFDDWSAIAGKHWSVAKSTLVSDGAGPALATRGEYGDMELRIEYSLTPKAECGICLRNTSALRLWDTTSDGGNLDRGAEKGSGGLAANSNEGRTPLVHADKPVGDWNSLRIVMVGERVRVHLNDKLVVDFARLENTWSRASPVPRMGKILLQPHRGEIRLRNLAIREIASTEANELLRKFDSSGFVPVFNGKNLDGWEGPLDQYELIDGAIVCKPKKGGNIYTREEFADFTARLEYRLPKGGNNGLAIRSPGGNAHVATQALCEIQILDDTAAQYAKLDPRQYNGSAYGMVAAHRGYLRSVGEWNFISVTAKGSTLTVELNGTRILDTDLATVTAFKDDTPHPGKNRTRGHFGFAGHNDPVAFRGIEIRKIEEKK
jgi:hypothetical protein